MYEVFFKGHHVMHFPWKANDEKVTTLSDGTVPFQNEVITVTRLCHITHSKEADEIEQDDCFEFKPKMKYGKNTTNNRVSAVICKPTYKAPNEDTKYRVITKDQELLPGYYSWWSIDSSCFPAKDDVMIESSNDFSLPYKSRFGNKKISGDITKLLQCYQEAVKSRSSWFYHFYGRSRLPRIEFRCGGTLRYNRQICKVIIICPKDELFGYPTLDSGGYPVLHSIGYRPTYNAELQIQSCGTLKLTIQNGVMISSGTRYSWDTYAFAFYFPSEDYVMKCPKSVPLPLYTPDFEVTDIEHDTTHCLRKGSGCCPNVHYIPKKRKRNVDEDDDDDELGPILKKSLFEF